MNSLKSMLAICAFLIYTSPIMAAESGPVNGTVAETMDSGGYVYMKLESGQWVAASSFEVSKGDMIQYSGAMEMNDFHSKSLDKTFESILFVSSASLVGKDNVEKAPTKLRGNRKVEKPVALQAPLPGEVKALPGGKTVAEIHTESGQLKDQVVSLRAKVMKINRHIMGRNWITLQDGTGTKLVATSQEVVALGDLVVAKGTINTDVDLGHGYFYKVMMEEAVFSPGQE